MSRIHVFADESGNFDFSRKVGASRYFILTTVTAPDGSVGDSLAGLRRQLTWEGHDLTCGFHATDDSHDVRLRVFGELAKLPIRVDSVILEKAKAQPQTRTSEPRFYKYAWFYHFKRVAQLIVAPNDELLVIAASLGTKKKRIAFHNAVSDVVGQVANVTSVETASWPAETDYCLQAADYCSWAMQRKWERGDDSWYKMIQPQVRTEFDLWSPGKTLYY
jgi:Protein of unknown function (DUF3800)